MLHPSEVSFELAEQVLAAQPFSVLVGAQIMSLTRGSQPCR